MTSISPGEVFLEKYRIERVLGQGGMGVVVAARHLDLDEPVAIKFLHSTFAVQQEQVERFLREGRAAVKIKSEHVARVRDVGKTDNGTPYMIMEHLEGHDLGDLIRREGKVSPPEAIEFVLQACEALAEAHVAGIVHRDLKPANLFLTERRDGSPCVKVLDFGISKLIDAQSQGAALTATNGMMGSPLYMAPEQLSSAKNVDHRADIWALGVILYELMSGARPFAAEGLPQLIFAVATEPPTPLREAEPSIPEPLAAVVMRCLEKKPDARYADIGALANDLAPFAPEEARASIERIGRVLSGVSTQPGGRRTRTARTMPQPVEIEPLAAAESAPTMAAPSSPASKLLVTTNGASINTTVPEPSAPKRSRVPLAAVAALAALALVVVLVSARRGERAGAATASEPPRTEPTPVATHVAEPPATATTTTPTTTAAPAPSPSPSPTWVVAEPSTSASAAAKHAPPTKKPGAKPTSGPSCDPPYVIDAEGNKKYKMECL